MYQRIPWEQVAEPKGSAEHTLGTTAVNCSKIIKIQYRPPPPALNFAGSYGLSGKKTCFVFK
jgi:hypothetical protein